MAAPRLSCAHFWATRIGAVIPASKLLTDKLSKKDCVLLVHTFGCVQIFLHRMCSNPTHFVYNPKVIWRHGWGESQTSPRHRLGILFCTHCLVYKICGQEVAGFGQPSSHSKGWIVGGGGRKGSSFSIGWKKYFSCGGNRTRATGSAHQAFINSSKSHLY